MCFLHLMPMGDSIFNIKFIELINKEFDASEHTFCFPSSVIKSSSISKTTFLHENCIVNDDYFKIEKLADLVYSFDYIFWHSNPYPIRQLVKIRKKYALKIVWCVWGHDLYRRNSNGFRSRLRSILIWPLQKKADCVISNFKLIVAGFKYDKVIISERFGAKIPVMNAVYYCGYNLKQVNEFISTKKKGNDLCTNILIGHSAFPFLQHIKYLHALYKYRFENIRIVLVLAYGDSQYANEVEKCAFELFPEKVIIIKEMLDASDYIRLLSEINVAIFDYDHQAAFGNLILLSYFHAKLYLSSSGVMSKGLLAEGVCVYDCNEVGIVSFDKFKSATTYNNQYAIDLLDQNQLYVNWLRIFNFLKGKL